MEENTKNTIFVAFLILGLIGCLIGCYHLLSTIFDQKEPITHSNTTFNTTYNTTYFIGPANYTTFTPILVIGCKYLNTSSIKEITFIKENGYEKTINTTDVCED